VNPIAEYLAELSGLLRRGRRRRILAEVRAHLLEAAATDSLHDIDPQRAARRAIERFGPPARVAGQFNALARGPRAILQRTAAVMLAGAAMTTLGTATVWALEPGGTHAHAHLQHARLTHHGAHR
jgi:hypothetical protein